MLKSSKRACPYVSLFNRREFRKAGFRGVLAMCALRPVENEGDQDALLLRRITACATLERRREMESAQSPLSAKG